MAFATAFDTSVPADDATVARSGGRSVNLIAITRWGVVAVNGAEPATIVGEMTSPRRIVFKKAR